MFSGPSLIVADSSSNLFVWDSGNYVIRKITPDGTVSTFAGGFGSGASSVVAMTIDQNNTIWMTSVPYILYEITSNSAVMAIHVPLWRPDGLCVDSLGNLYLSDALSNNIYRCSPTGDLTLFAGSGNSGYLNGNGIFTAFNAPGALTSDPAGNIYVWDSNNGVIRKIDQSQNVSTYAGEYPYSGLSDGPSTIAGFFEDYAMCFDPSGNLILACGTSVRQVTAAMNVNTLAGSFFTPGYSNGTGSVARFYGASGVCASQGLIFVADSDNQRIRQISLNPQPQIVSGPNLGLATYSGLTISGVVGRTYQIQTSPDMTSWNTVATMVLPSTPYLWFDQNPVAGNKFYRALLLP